MIFVRVTNIARMREIDMNKIVDKKEVKAKKKNETCRRSNLKCETSQQFRQSQLLTKGTV